MLIDDVYTMKLKYQSKFAKVSLVTDKDDDETKDKETSSIDSIQTSKVKAHQGAISVCKVLSGTNFVNLFYNFIL